MEDCILHPRFYQGSNHWCAGLLFSRRQRLRLPPCPCSLLPWCPWNANSRNLQFPEGAFYQGDNALVPLPFQKRSIKADVQTWDRLSTFIAEERTVLTRFPGSIQNTSMEMISVEAQAHKLSVVVKRILTKVALPQNWFHLESFSWKKISHHFGGVLRYFQP